jgi:hypothetical protein
VNLGAFNLTAASIIRTGGTSSQFLKADGSVDSSTYQPLLTNPVTGTGASGQVAYWNGTSSQTGSNNLFWNSANNRLGINTNTPTASLQVVGTMKATLVETPLVYSTGSDQIGLGTQGGTIGLLVNATTRNVEIKNGIFGDTGQRLQVGGDAFIKGSGATSATFGLTVQNSNAENYLRARNDGRIILGSQTVNFAPFIQPNNGVSTLNIDGTHLYFGNANNDNANTGPAGFWFEASFSAGSGGQSKLLNLTGTFTGATGAEHTNLRLGYTINQVAGATGITRGLYVNPTLTAAADWRSIEWSNNSGWGLYGAGTARNYLVGRLLMGTTSSIGNLVVNLNITGATIISGVYQLGAVQTDVTNIAVGFWNAINTAASATFNSYQHYRADEGSIGAGTSLGLQTGFLATGLVTGTTVLGFRGQIANAADRWNLFMDGTADNYLAGKLLIGTTTVSTFALDVNGTARVTGAATFSSTVTATSFIKSGGTSSQYLMADGSTSTLTNPVTGTGTTNFLPKWTSGSAIGNSQIFDNGTSVGINNASPSSIYVLDVNARDVSYNTRFYQPSSSTSAYNSVFISGAMTSANAYFGIGGSATGNTSFRDAVVIGSQSSHPLVFNTSDTERARFTAGGNLLVGTTTDNGSRFQVSGAATFSSTLTVSSRLTLNGVGTSEIYTTDASGLYLTAATSGGMYIASESRFIFRKATSPFTEYMRIESTGNVCIGTISSSASAILQADSTTKGFLPPRGTNTQMLAIASPATGLMFYDTTNNKLNCYDGTTWQACW